MQFIKSLFCWHGFDNRIRFISISFLSLICFIIINESFINNPLLAIFGLLTLLALMLATTQRRLRDAQLYRNWLFAPAGTFLATGLIIIFIGHSSIYWLLLLPLLLCLLLLTYPSKKQRQYIFGYNGPVSLAEYQSNARSATTKAQRIEPTMSAEISSNDYPNSHQHTSGNNAATHISKTENDLGESIRLILFSNRNAQLTLSAIATLLIVAIAISYIFTDSTDVSEPIQPKMSQAKNNTLQLTHRITLPDNFDLLVSAHNGLVINWQADSTNENKLWDIATAVGDANCQKITFHKGESIRSNKVTVENGDEYFAYFSPLDTKTLVKSLAMKGRFSLCGYNFSLKGSQATLGKKDFYAEILAE